LLLLPVVNPAVLPVITAPETWDVKTLETKLAVVPVTVTPVTEPKPAESPVIVVPEIFPLTIMLPLNVGFLTKPDTDTVASEPPYSKSN